MTTSPLTTLLLTSLPPLFSRALEMMTYEFQEALRPRRRWCRGAMGMAGLVWGGGGEGYGERKEQVTSLQETSHCSLHSTLRSTAVVVCAVRRQGRHRSVVICWQRGAPASAPTNAVTSSSGIFPLSEEENVSGKKTSNGASFCLPCIRHR